MRYCLILLFLCGCQSASPRWEWLGITSLDTHKRHVDEARDFYQDAVKNQSRIVEITNDLNNEDIYLAKSNDDQAMLERVYSTRGKIEYAREVSEELSEREFSKVPDPPFNWGSIIQMVLSALGVGGPLGLIAMSQKNRIKNLAQEAIMNGKSTEVNETGHLERYR